MVRPESCDSALHSRSSEYTGTSPAAVDVGLPELITDRVGDDSVVLLRKEYSESERLRFKMPAMVVPLARRD